jgi:hypothetical protein
MTWLIRLSVLLNLALLLGAVFVWRRPDPAADRGAPGANSTQSTQSETSADPADDQSTGRLIQITVTNAFRWDGLESTNYAAFAANLRAVHCPEATIRDIILADASRRYQSWEEEDADLTLAFWAAGRARTEANRVAAARRHTAQTDLVGEVQNALGIEFYPDGEELHHPGIAALARVLVGPVSDAEFEATMRWFLATQQSHDQFRRGRQGVLLRADQAEWQTNVRERLAQLQQSLAPAAFEEFQARTAFMEELTDDDQLHLRLLELDASELRGLSLLKVKQIGWLDDFLHLDSDVSGEAPDSRQLALVAAAQSILTPAHHEEFVRIQDEEYRDLVELTYDHELPRRVAAQVYTLHQAAKTEFTQLRQQSEDPAAVAAAAELQVATAAAVAKLLGPDAYKRYLNNGGNWMNQPGKP